MAPAPHPQPHPESMPGTDWAYRDPPYLVPVPARLEQPLHGRRVVLHHPEVPCWRYDLVAVREADADNAVGVIDQYDFHRAQRDGVGISIALVGIDQLWVERIYWSRSSIPDELQPPPVDVPVEASHIDPEAWLEHPIQPPIRRMRAGNKTGGHMVIGARVAWRQSSGRPVQGMRLISGPHLHNYGTPNLAFGLDEIDQPLYHQAVTICDERDYFAWAATGEHPPSARIVQLGAILIE